MGFTEGLSFPVAAVYLGFFAASLLILGLILLSGLPAGLQRLLHAVRVQRARRTRSLRMLADPEQLEEAGRRLEGVILFSGDWADSEGPQEGDEAASALNSDAA